MTRFRAAHVLALALALSPALAHPAHAQIDRTYAPASEAHEAGRWSLQFSIAENFQLRGFVGSGLSITKNTSPQGAWELGFTYDARTKEQSEEGRDLSLTPPTLDMERSDDRTFLDFRLLRLHRYHPDRRVGLQFGVGPALSYSHAHSEADGQRAAQTTHEIYTSSDYGIGVGATLGTEVFVAPAISLHARYSGSLRYSWGTESWEHSIVDTSGGPAVETTQNVETTSHGWALAGQGVTFGLSVYF